MGTKVTIRQEDNVVILDLAGRFVNTLSIRATIIDLLEKGTLNILVILKKAKLIGNGTIGEIVWCLKLVTEKGGAFKVLNPDEEEKYWLKESGVDKILDIYYDEQKALSSFK